MGGSGKITYGFAVNCGRCGETLSLAERTHDLCAQWLRGEGWSQTKDVGWVCPPCAEARVQERLARRRERNVVGFAPNPAYQRAARKRLAAEAASA